MMKIYKGILGSLERNNWFSMIAVLVEFMLAIYFTELRQKIQFEKKSRDNFNLISSKIS